MKKMIYADHAATTRLSEAAYQAMMKYLERDYANPSSLYSQSIYARRSLGEAREKIASLIGAKPQEIYFTSGGTESDNWALKGVVGAQPGKLRRIVTSSIEHHAILRPCAFLEEWGHEIVHIGVSREGEIDLPAFEKAMEEKPALASVMLANNEIGTIQPIAKLADLAHASQCLFHTDAVQAVGHIPVDVEGVGVDMLSASAHKFGGPKGIGFLYVREGVVLSPLHHGGAQERSFRAGTEDVASIVAMAAALEESCCHMEHTTAHLHELERIVLGEMDKSGIAYLRNGGSKKLPGLLSLSFPGQEGEKLLHRLDLLGVSISTGSACNSRETEISHVLRAIGLEEEYAKGTIRISLGAENTCEEVWALAKILKKVLGYL
ncbi:cysteine desulfurase family protein [Selenomonas sp. KH1T6]|uniref:cysteine desulfurase family protein n=1 Tax=Selenomonas sp. KH1T6 TaxID=3158784 RepID=UPI0008A78B8C|nr:cysteine desulfurase [Selenomonas ruminantium]